MDSNKYLYVIPFKYQLYWIRVFSIVPFCFLFSWIEYRLFGRMIDPALFYLISAVILLLFVNFVFKPLELFFARNGLIIIDEKTIYFFKKRKKVSSCNIHDLENVEVMNIKIYGSNVDKIIITGRKFRLALYSAEEKKENIEDTKSKIYTFNEIASILKEVASI